MMAGMVIDTLILVVAVAVIIAIPITRGLIYLREKVEGIFFINKGRKGKKKRYFIFTSGVLDII